MQDIRSRFVSFRSGTSRLRFWNPDQWFDSVCFGGIPSLCALPRLGHLVRPVWCRTGKVVFCIVFLPIISINAYGSAYAEDVVTTSLNNAVVGDCAASFVLYLFFIEVWRVVVIAANHHNPVVCLAESCRVSLENILVVSWLFKAESAIAGNDGIIVNVLPVNGNWRCLRPLRLSPYSRWRQGRLFLCRMRINSNQQFNCWLELLWRQ